MEPTATVFDLLPQLAVNAGRVLSYETLLGRVWGRSKSRVSSSWQRVTGRSSSIVLSGSANLILVEAVVKDWRRGWG